MGSLEILCFVLLGFAVVQAQAEEPAETNPTESTQMGTSTTSVYDRLADRMKKLGDRSNARAEKVADKFNEASAKIQEKMSELNAQRAATGDEIWQKARSGASNVYDRVSDVAAQFSASMLSLFAETAVGAFRLGHEITAVGQPTDPTQELINLLEDE